MGLQTIMDRYPWCSVAGPGLRQATAGPHPRLSVGGDGRSSLGAPRRAFPEVLRRLTVLASGRKSLQKRALDPYGVDRDGLEWEGAVPHRLKETPMTTLARRQRPAFADLIDRFESEFPTMPAFRQNGGSHVIRVEDYACAAAANNSASPAGKC